MPPSKKLLLLSYAFPPMAYAESYLSTKTVGNIPGYEVDVFCARATDHGARIDNVFESYAREKFKSITRVSRPWWWSLFPRGRIPGRFLPWLVQLPDPLVFLNRSTLQQLRRLDLSQYSAVLTWSNFLSVHLLGLSLKKEFPRLPWLAHFSDPWIDNPFMRYRGFVKRVNERMEKSVIEMADKLIFTSDNTVELMLEKYPHRFREKACVVPHPFDPALYGEVSDNAHPKSEIVFRYLGGFYGNRTPASLLLALDKIAGEAPELLTGTRFEFVGEVEKGIPGCKPSARIAAQVKFLPPVDYVTSLQLMKSADALLVIDAPADKSVFLPSKLVDYLGSGRPIIGITPRGTSADLIGELGYPVADPGSVDSVVHVMRAAISDLKSGKLRASASNSAVVARYSVSAVGEQMARLIG